MLLVNRKKTEHLLKYQGIATPHPRTCQAPPQPTLAHREREARQGSKRLYTFQQNWVKSARQPWASTLP